MSVPRPGTDTRRELRAKPVLGGEESHGVEVGRHLLAGDERLQQGDVDGALRELTAAIALEPNEAAGYAKRAAVWLKMGFADSALLDVDDAMRRGDNSAGLYRLKAEVFLALDDSVGGTMAASEAIRRDPADVRSFAVRGTAYLKRKEFDEAIRDLGYATEKDPALMDEVKTTLAEAYYRRGKSHEKAQQTAEAKSDLAQAAQLGWKTEPSATP